jgi:hypothetical protein
MKDLPNRCICGYQGKIDRLEKELEKWKKIATDLYIASNIGGVDMKFDAYDAFIDAGGAK